MENDNRTCIVWIRDWQRGTTAAPTIFNARSTHVKWLWGIVYVDDVCNIVCIICIYWNRPAKLFWNPNKCTKSKLILTSINFAYVETISIRPTIERQNSLFFLLFHFANFQFWLCMILVFFLLFLHFWQFDICLFGIRKLGAHMVSVFFFCLVL